MIHGAGNQRRLILDAAIDGSVISGTLRDPTGDARPFHGWLELNTAIEAAFRRDCGEQAVATPEPGAGE